MKKLSCISITALALTLAQTQAVVIISADFTGSTEGASLTGTAPNSVNTPGNNWVKPTSVQSFNTTTTAGFGNPVPGAFGQSGQSASSILLNSGTYTAPSNALITLSMDMKPLAGGVGSSGFASNGRGLALGYYSITGGTFSSNRFTGLVLDNVGTLGFVRDPNATDFFTGPGSTLGPTVAFGGTFATTAFYTLNYTINRTTGAITAVSLSGSSANYSSLLGTAAFTEAATAYAGFYVSGETAGDTNFSAIDNFSVDVVPEPSAAVLIGAAGMLTLLRRRRS